MMYSFHEPRGRIHLSVTPSLVALYIKDGGNDGVSVQILWYFINMLVLKWLTERLLAPPEKGGSCEFLLRPDPTYGPRRLESSMAGCLSRW